MLSVAGQTVQAAERTHITDEYRCAACGGLPFGTFASLRHVGTHITLYEPVLHEVS